MGLAPKTRLGVFEVVSPLGSGGMGEVYLARDTELKREVAIKALPEEVAGDPDRVARFQREARVLASMNHPNIGAIFGIERRDERLFLVLELVRGDTLAERFDAGALTLREVLTIFKQIANALEAAHAKEIVHRDLKPDNVKITPEGLVKVLDFGLAKPFVEERSDGGSKTKTAPSHVTNAGHVLGTPAYMSPEQTRGEALDKRTDIWSFGCCLYEALTGRRPFKGNSISETLAAVLTEQPDFGALPRVVPRSIRHLLRRCLEKDVQRRLHDISDARLEVDAMLERDDLKPGRIGEPSLLIQKLHRDPLTGAAFCDVSEDGTLVYVPRAEDMSGEVSGQLLHVDRDGSYRVALPTPRSYQVPRVSPTDQRLMFTLTVGEKTDVYITELARGTLGRVTFEGNNGAAIWSPDGRAVFSSDRDGEALNLYSKAVDGSEPVKRLTVSASHHFPSSWSPDGTVLAYTELNLETSLDIWLFSSVSQRMEPWLHTAFNESAAAFSPNGKWLAYVSDETGEDEVYVSAFPGPGGKTTISSGGGREPQWSPDGSELYYREKEWLMAVSVATVQDFDAGAPRRLFEAPFDEAGAPYANYDVARESDGFIMVRSDEERSASRLVVVLNWFKELRRLAPTEP